MHLSLWTDFGGALQNEFPIAAVSQRFIGFTHPYFTENNPFPLYTRIAPMDPLMSG